MKNIGGGECGFGKANSYKGIIVYSKMLENIVVLDMEKIKANVNVSKSKIAFPRNQSLDQIHVQLQQSCLTFSMKIFVVTIKKINCKTHFNTFLAVI